MISTPTGPTSTTTTRMGTVWDNYIALWSMTYNRGTFYRDFQTTSTKVHSRSHIGEDFRTKCWVSSVVAT